MGKRVYEQGAPHLMSNYIRYLYVWNVKKNIHNINRSSLIAEWTSDNMW